MGRLVFAILLCCVFALCSGTSTPVPVKTITQLCPSKTVSINFNGTYLRNIGAGFLSGYKDLVCLDLQTNTIEHIDVGAFEKLTKLQYLLLSRNSFTTLKDMLSFKPINSLKTLSLDHAYLDWLPNGKQKKVLEFKHTYPQLLELSLRANRIDTITQPGFKPRPNLSTVKSIDLTKQKTTIWKYFPKLEFLDLAENMMTEWEFPGFLPASLKYLNLAENRLKYFHAEYLGKLNTLILDSNEFTSLNYTILQTGSVCLYGMKGLTVLSLAKNKLATINCDAFKDTKSLKIINLANNSISTIRVGCFDVLSQLESLDLQNNYLTKVPEAKVNLNLKYLDLSHNNIDYLAPGTFKEMRKLKALSLSSNSLANINEHSFNGLDSLEELDLSSNQMKSLPPKWTASLKKLLYLNMRDNLILTLNSLSLTKTLPLLQLSFEGNPLTNLTANAFANLPAKMLISLDVGKKCT